jgi:hypothetical protein
MIDVTITATRRPQILEKTLDSFKEFFDVPTRCIINVDPVGDDIESGGITDLASRYFRYVTFRTPSDPAFGVAFKWCWMQSDASWVFHLEEDWELLQPVRASRLIEILEDEKDLALLRLPMFHSGPTSMKNWGHFYPWNGTYYECPYEKRVMLGFCGHPSMIRGEFVSECAPALMEDRNPEKQFHDGPMEILLRVLNYRYGVYGKPETGPFIRDIGREWMKTSGWTKSGNASYFTQWEKV